VTRHVLGRALKAAGAVAIPETLARAALPALAAAAAVALAGAGILCWVLSSADRTRRLAMLITAARNTAAVPAPGSSARPSRGPDRTASWRDRVGLRRRRTSSRP
jgi:hypothetical protein